MTTTWFRQRKKPVVQDADLEDEPGDRTSPVSLGVLILLLPLALLLLIAGNSLHATRPIISAILEHFASALIVASVIGLSYESLLHKHREKALRQILKRHQRETYDAIQAYGATTPKEVFGLLKDIAKQTRKMPTLYQPPREKDDEYTFADSCDFFEKIIRVQGNEVVEILKKWVEAEDAPHNLRFLASDFTGKYRLREMAEELWPRAKKDLDCWKELRDTEKYCTLNYVWAVSRCEEPRYEKLKELLLHHPDPKISEWILFIPQQMPEDHEFLEIIEEYLEQRFTKDTLSPGVVQRSLAALERHHPGKGEKLLERFSHLFVSETEWEETTKAWQEIGRRLPTKLVREERRLDASVENPKSP